ncbi:mucin-2-like [Ostrinia nubilalis]|uniref:mucin-2-like n=1 Tax=Ostrinia nubilalis TaxID=29057 RepID=UPI00308223B4
MKHAAPALVVITLLQLCQAEISEIVPGTWFSANAINDGYSPKPISEIFSTEPPFSPTKPIIVLPSFSSLQQEAEVTHHSTSTPEYYPSSTPYPPTSTPYPTVNVQFEESSSPRPPSSSTFPSSSVSYSSTPNPFITPSSTPLPNYNANFLPSSYSSTLSTFNPIVPSNAVTTPSSEYFDFSQTPRTPSQAPQFTTQTETTRSGKSTMSQTQSITYDGPQSQQPLFLPPTQTTAPPNYFVIYQNAPQMHPAQFPQQQLTSGVTQPPVFITSPISTTTPLPPSSTSLATFSDGTSSPFITNGLTDSTDRPTITFRSTPPTLFSRTTAGSLCNSTRYPPPRSSPRPSLQVHPGPPRVPFMSNLKIRVVAPKGSITNVKINPSTTTKPPPTRRTKKPKKNSYDGCMDSCKGRKDPLCAVPLATVIVDPKTLRGFNSICHMACHNSYKPDPYEKLVDGRCGRLRTRIIRVDGNQKVHREELKKSEYSVINTGPKTIVEFAHGSHSK